MQKGIFITIYGINNIGKSTQSKLLVDRLNSAGYKAKYVKYPVYDIEPTGPFLDKVLRGGEQKISEDELQLWFIMNRYQFQPTLQKWLEEGYIVIAEDYTQTGIAWGCAKGLSQEWLESANSHLLKEDFSILMEGNRDKNAFEEGHVHEQNEELIEKCRKVFDDLALKNNWLRLRVEEKIEDTSEKLWELVSSYLKQKQPVD